VHHGRRHSKAAVCHVAHCLCVCVCAAYPAVTPPPGCAFVTYATWAATEAAIEALNGTFTFPGAGQPIMVKLADAKPQDMQRVGAKRGIDVMGGGERGKAVWLKCPLLGYGGRACYGEGGRMGFGSEWWGHARHLLGGVGKYGEVQTRCRTCSRGRQQHWLLQVWREQQ
jgi:hypothetical protein